MSLADDAEEAWDNRMDLLREADDPDYARKCFLEGYLAGMKDVGEQMYDPKYVTGFFGQDINVHGVSTHKDPVYMDEAYIAQIRTLCGKED